MLHVEEYIQLRDNLWHHDAQFQISWCDLICLLVFFIILIIIARSILGACADGRYNHIQPSASACRRRHDWPWIRGDKYQIRPVYISPDHDLAPKSIYSQICLHTYPHLFGPELAVLYITGLPMTRIPLFLMDHL